MFASIGFELVTLILISVWVGDYFIKEGYPQYLQAFAVLLAFLIWFISLIVKLKSIKND